MDKTVDEQMRKTINDVVNGKAVVITSGPVVSLDDEGKRYGVVISGPETVMKALIDLLKGQEK